MENKVNATYARMQAPSEVNGRKIYAFCAEGIGSGYVIADNQDPGVKTPFIVGKVIELEDGRVMLNNYNYVETLPMALVLFTYYVQEITKDEVKTVESLRNK